MNRSALLFMLCLLLFSVASCESLKQERKIEISNENLLPYSVKMVFPHDEKAFTQGLVIYKGKIYESTGYHNFTRSWIAEVDLDNGEHDKKVELHKSYFGEGICILNNKMYQLSWKENTGFVYELGSFKNIGTFAYDSEGWGLTTDGQHLIMSDGTNKISFLDTLTFEIKKAVFVTENNIPVSKLNELEYIEGYIFANQWETSYIVKIDPATGKVVGRLDLSPLVNEIQRNSRKAEVLNGIAYNDQTGELLVTGKLWPKAYLIRLGN